MHAVVGEARRVSPETLFLLSSTEPVDLTSLCGLRRPRAFKSKSTSTHVLWIRMVNILNSVYDALVSLGQ